LTISKPASAAVPTLFYSRFASIFVTMILNRPAGVILNVFIASAMADFSSGAPRVPGCLPLLPRANAPAGHQSSLGIAGRPRQSRLSRSRWKRMLSRCETEAQAIRFDRLRDISIC
jgi:hypothetical protein